MLSLLKILLKPAIARDAPAPALVATDRTGLVIAAPDGLADALVTQLVDIGLACREGSAARINWAQFFAASEDFAELASLLELPANQLTPHLASEGSLSDAAFGIGLSWLAHGRATRAKVEGGLLIHDGQSYLLTPAQWQLSTAVQAFAARRENERTDLQNRLAWGRIRKLAVGADANLQTFLANTVVLTPEKLELRLTKAKVADDTVVTVAPTFDGAPDAWLPIFDGTRDVPERYDISTGDGIVQVVVSAPVREVLQGVKRFSGRRVAGQQAQAFIRNPFALLGESSGLVLDAAQIEREAARAGVRYERFVPFIARDALEFPVRVGLRIDSAGEGGDIETHVLTFDDEMLASFVAKLTLALNRQHSLLGWRGFDLELTGDAAAYLHDLSQALTVRVDVAQSGRLISQVEVHDLSNYSDRIAGFGVERPYYSPFIAKKREGDGWVPENIVPLISYTPPGATEPVAVPVDAALLAKLRESAAEVAAAGGTEVTIAELPEPMPLVEAERLTATFEEAVHDVSRGTFPPAPQKKTILLRSNIDKVDHQEKRGAVLTPPAGGPELPQALKPTTVLKTHQLAGLAWLQHLHKARAVHNVRGALLADDMGLGKTLQLLAYMAWVREAYGPGAPMLVVAPVSLLENWVEEAKKFLKPGALTLLTAYGDGLARLRVNRHDIDRRLAIEDGQRQFLTPDWIRGADVVLTTYETLRDLELSFAREKWSVMVCDEAQRIKNPAAMVTRAAKKQNVEFRVAVTGTPVENTLADLWSLFDFMQPGLLGALNDFGKTYRKPIEAKTDAERARVEELRALVAPQILRRMKRDVAKDLPRKIEVPDCRIPMSAEQMKFYTEAVDDYKKRIVPGYTPHIKNKLGLIQHLRNLCTAPAHPSVSVFKEEPLADYRRKAPKLDWLLKTLTRVQAAGEKALVFCEFKETQRMLQCYIAQALGYKADIINGDTTVSAAAEQSRQKRINAFQAAPEFGVLILSPVAVGFGVNIQAANHVIHYTRCWNPAKEDQATDRAYRIGQTKDVYVYCPQVFAPDWQSFDVTLDLLLTAKRALAEDILNGAGDLTPEDFAAIDDLAVPADAALQVQVDLETALRLDWRAFEGLAAVLWSKRGYTTYCTPESGDVGVDVVAVRGSEGVLVQCKSATRDGAELGWDAVKELAGGEAFYKRKHPGVEFRKVALTNQFFNDYTKRRAAENEVQLVDQDGLAEMLAKTPASLAEVHAALPAPECVLA